MKIEIRDANVGILFGMLEEGGYRARLVGGAVRDIVAGLKPKDMDLATDALPEIVMSLAEAAGHRVIPTGLQHGTVTVVLGGLPYEITTLRRDVETDGRHAMVQYVSDFKEDAARRDFTFNAMSATADGEVHDYFDGVRDLHGKRVRFVGRAEDRIAEDYLRILRFFRFRARFGGSEEGNELEALRDSRHGLSGISVERVWSEVSRILVHANGRLQVVEMGRLGISDVIGLPVIGDHPDLAASAAAFDARPGTVLGLLCSDAAHAEDLAARWKLSNAEMGDAVAAAEVAADPAAEPDYWLGRASDGLDVTRAVPVLRATGRLEAAESLSGPIPVFPLKGRDLVELCEPGPRLGQLLSEAREEWKASGFRMSREDLIESVAAKMTATRRM